MVVSNAVLSHNKIDCVAMSKFLDADVLKKGFTLEEDHWKDLAPGVTWRRRRFRFLLTNPEQPEEPQHEGLCINEIIVDSHADAEITPVLAAEHSGLVDMEEIENAYWATTFAMGAIRASEARKEARLFLNMSHFLAGDIGHDVRNLAQLLRKVDQSPEAWEEVRKELEPFDPEVIPYEGGTLAVGRYAAAFAASRLVQSSDEIIAATNAGYFLNFPEEYADGVSCLHQPVGGHMVDGRLVFPCWFERPGILSFRNGDFRAELFGVQDMELHLGGLPPVRLNPASGKVPVHGKTWRNFEEPVPAPGPDAAQLAFTGSLLVDAADGSHALAPPSGGATVWVEGEHANYVMENLGREGLRAKVRMRRFDEGEPEWLVSAGPFLVREGKALLSADSIFRRENAGEFRPGGPPPTRFPYDTEKTQAPRTAIGTTAAGGLKIVVVDGRRSGEHSCGLTLQGLAHLMEKLACETVVNLDGGGSSIMAIEGATLAEMLRDNSPYGVVNVPSDAGGRERIMPVFLAVKRQDKSGG